MLLQFVLAAGSLFVLVQVIKMIGGTPLLPLAWQDVAMPLGAAAIFTLFRTNRGGRPQ